ncbi:MAG: lectin like domain-containing protein [Bacteroidales bacterium]
MAKVLIKYWVLIFLPTIILGQDSTSLDIDCLNLESMDIPMVFDLRNSDILSPVRSQPGGGCWATASNTTVESWWRKSGFNTQPLSDRNLQLFHGFEENRNTYGNHFMSTAYYSRGSGPINQNPDTDTIPFVIAEILFRNTQARYLPNNPELIKKIIFTLGPVYTMLYFRKADTDTISHIHYSNKEKINHALSLVGWNDTLATEKGKGVWIAQNSLSVAFGDSGFVYIPYQDKNILEHNAIWPGWEPYNPNQQIYYYDTLGPIHSYGFDSPVCYGLTKFTAQKKGRIEQVSSFAHFPDTYIQAHVYRSFDEKEKLLSGLLSESKEKHCPFSGYYTFDLSTPVYLEKDENFYVLVKYFVPDENMPMPVEQYLEGYADPHITTGNSWINPDIEQWPNAWYEVGANSSFIYLNFDLCIRAILISVKE